MKKNVFTTVFGILTIASSLAPIWAPAHIAAKIQASTAVLSGVGLIGAADAQRKETE